MCNDTRSVEGDVGICRVGLADGLVKSYSLVRAVVEHSQGAIKDGYCKVIHSDAVSCPIKPPASSSSHEMDCPESTIMASGWPTIFSTPQILQTWLGIVVECLAVGLDDGAVDGAAIGNDDSFSSFILHLLYCVRRGCEAATPFIRRMSLDSQ